MKLLAVDYGLKRLGLAYSEGSLAEPIGKLVVKNQVDALQKVLRTAHTYEVDVIIVGLPDPDSIGAREFGERLAKMIDKKVEFVDETMSSREAMTRLLTTSRKKRAEMVDSAAASIILTSYLNDRHIIDE